MKKVMAAVLVAACVGLAVHSANAQVPNVQVYFDAALTQTSQDCGVGSQTLHVVAQGFGMWLSALEYQVLYPPEVMWLADIADPQRLDIGSSASGIASSWTIPLNAFSSVLVLDALVNWSPTCDCAGGASPLVVGPHPSTGAIRAVRWPDNVLITGIVGMTALVCPGTVPVEETSWGQVKALYNN